MRCEKIAFDPSEKHLIKLAKALQLEPINHLAELSQTLEKALQFLSPFTPPGQQHGKTIIIKDFPLTGKTSFAYHLAKLWLQACWQKNRQACSVVILQPENAADLTAEKIDDAIAQTIPAPTGEIGALVVIDNFEGYLGSGNSSQILAKRAATPSPGYHKILLVTNGVLGKSYQDLEPDPVNHDQIMFARMTWDQDDLRKYYAMKSRLANRPRLSQEILEKNQRDFGMKREVESQDGRSSILIGLAGLSLEPAEIARALFRTKTGQSFQDHPEAQALFFTLSELVQEQAFAGAEAIPDEIVRDLFTQAYQLDWGEFEQLLETLVSAGLVSRRSGLIKISPLWWGLADVFSPLKSYPKLGLDRYFQRAAFQFSRPVSYKFMALCYLQQGQNLAAIRMAAECSDRDMRQQVINQVVKQLLPESSFGAAQVARDAVNGFLYQVYLIYQHDARQKDLYRRYEMALETIEQLLPERTAEYETIKLRLVTNIAEARQFGETDSRKSERYQTVYHLNQEIQAQGVPVYDFLHQDAPVPPLWVAASLRKVGEGIFAYPILDELCDAAQNLLAQQLGRAAFALDDLADPLEIFAGLHHKYRAGINAIRVKHALLHVSIPAAESPFSSSAQIDSLSLKDLVMQLFSLQSDAGAELDSILERYLSDHPAGDPHSQTAWLDITGGKVWTDLEETISALVKRMDKVVVDPWIRGLLKFCEKIFVSPRLAYLGKICLLSRAIIDIPGAAAIAPFLKSIYQEQGHLLFFLSLAAGETRFAKIGGKQFKKYPLLYDRLADQLDLSLSLDDFICQNAYIGFTRHLDRLSGGAMAKRGVGSITRRKDQGLEEFFLYDQIYRRTSPYQSIPLTLAITAQGNNHEDEIDPFEKQLLASILIFMQEFYRYGNPSVGNELMGLGLLLAEQSGLVEEQKLIEQYSQSISAAGKSKRQPLSQYPQGQLVIKDPYLGRAVIAFNGHRIHEAVNIINTYLAGNEYNPDAWYLLGLCSMQLFEDIKAIQDFNTCVTLNPKYIPAYMQIASIYHKLEKPNVEIATLKKALQIDRFDYRINYALGNAYLQQKQYKKAIEYYLYAREMLPEQAQREENVIRRNLAACYQQVGNFEKALWSYLEGIREGTYNADLLPGFLDIIEQLQRQKNGLIFQGQKLNGNALIHALLKHMLSRYPRFEDLVAISSTYFYFNDFANGWKTYQQICASQNQNSQETNPLDLLVHLLVHGRKPELAKYYQGIQSLLKEEYEGAILNFVEYLHQFPFHAEAYYYLGKAQLELARVQIALKISADVENHLESALTCASRARFSGIPRRLCNELAGDILVFRGDQDPASFARGMEIFDELAHEQATPNILGKFLNAKYRDWTAGLAKKNLAPQAALAEFEKKILPIGLQDLEQIQKDRIESTSYIARLLDTILHFYDLLIMGADTEDLNNQKTFARLLAAAETVLKHPVNEQNYQVHVARGNVLWEKQRWAAEQAKTGQIKSAVEEWEKAQSLIHTVKLTRIERTIREELEIKIGSGRKKLKLLMVS